MTVHDALSQPTAREVLEAFYAAERVYMAAGGAAAGASFDQMAATLHPDVVLHQTPDLPWGGEYVGHDGFRDWSVQMSGHFDIVDVQNAVLLTQDNQVVILCDLVTRTRATGETLMLPMAQVVTVRDGQITEFRPFYWNVPRYVAATRAAPAADSAPAGTTAATSSSPPALSATEARP